MEKLADIAKEEPQLAYQAFVKGGSARWSYVMRTIPNIQGNLEPLESTIRHRFIPSVIGRQVSSIERGMTALPVRFGGLGIVNP